MNSLPLRSGDAADAVTIRAVFARAGFSERTICERLRVPALDAVDLPLFKTYRHRLVHGDLLDWLAEAFLFGDLVDPPSREWMAVSEIEAFTRADLLRQWNSPDGRERLFSPVRLVPIQPWKDAAGELLLAGDRGDHPDGSRFTPFPDIVFSGHNPLTRQFLRLLPQTAFGDVLDLCSGSGVGALALAQSAGHCVGVDVAARSAHFAAFNTWLNGCARLEWCCGNLYEPVRGRRFDRIIAHPPYVPALTQELTYRDGGQTGDEIVRGIVNGIPSHLDEGGTFHLLFLGMDTEQETIEERARGWLGASQREFDLVFALDSRTPPELIATRLVQRSGGSLDDLDRWRQLFQGIQVKEFVYGALVGRRRPAADEGDAMTRRVLLDDDTTAQCFDDLFGWFDWYRLPDLHERVLASMPRLSADVRLDVRHRVRDGTFTPDEYSLANGGRPFPSVMKTDVWVAALLNELDGTRTVADVFSAAKSRDRAPQDFADADLIRLIGFLLERGCLDLDRA